MSDDAVRQAIGAWAATARNGRARPTMELIRTAAGVACAIAELAAAVPVDRDTLPLHTRGADVEGEEAARAALTRPVAYDPARLGEMAGASAREVERALEILRHASVVSQLDGDRGALVLSMECLALAPAIAAVAWPVVRDRLAAAGAPIAAPCATLRALAERLGTVDLGQGVDSLPAVRMSVRDLELVTEFRRSTVSDAVAALVRARLLDADARAGHTGRFVIRPAAFGFPGEEPAAPHSNSMRLRLPLGEAVAMSDRTARSAARDAGPPTLRPVAGAPILVGTFAGTPIYAPQGTPLVVECDADGQWLCRVGPFLQLGPVADR